MGYPETQMEHFQRWLWNGAKGDTSSIGNAGGTTLIDTARTEVNDFWNEFTIMIITGNNIGEVRQIIDFDAASDTITVGRAFTNQVASGVGYIIRRDFNYLMGANNAANLADTSNVSYDIDGSMVERTESLVKALQIVAAAGTGFEEDGSGATLYNSVVAFEGLTTSGGTTSTIVATGLGGYAADYWNGNKVVMLENNSAGVVRTIVDFDGTSALTVEPLLPAASSDASAFIILNQKGTDWIIGDDTANNAYVSTNITVNNDGSVFERVEGILSQCRSKGYRGDIYYVSTAGNDSDDGLTIATAFLTINYAITQCTTANDDVIIVLAGSFDQTAAGVNGAALNKNSVHLFGLGSGSTVLANSNGAAVYVIYITGTDCEVSGFEINETTNTVEGIYIGGINSTVHNMIFRGAMENGIQVATTYSEIYNCKFYTTTNDGIEITTTECIIHDNYFNACGDNGINVSSDRNVIYDNKVIGVGTTTNGITLAATADNNMLTDNYIVGCTNEIVDGGTGNEVINAARMIGANNAANAFDSSAVVADEDGSTLERLEDINVTLAEIAGMSRLGTVSTSNTNVNFHILELAGYGDDFFNTDWVMVCLHNADNDGVAPEGEIRDITDYTSIDGDFIIGVAFGGVPTVGDEMMVARREFFTTDGVALQTTPAASSLAYHLSTMLGSGDGDWTGGTVLASNKSIIDALGQTGADVTVTGDRDAAAIQERIDAISLALGIVTAAAVDGFEDTGANQTLYNMLVSTDANGNVFTGDGGTSYDDNLYSFLKKLSTYVADGDGDFAAGTALPSNVSLYDVTGAFTGDGGADQNDSVKASLDLAHTDLDAILASIEPDLGGVALYGIVTTATSDTQVKVAGLLGKGTNAFNDRYYCHIIEADNAAPEGETRKISAYDTADGDITVGVAFSVAPDVGDQILILHESLALMFMHADATLTSVIDDSIIAHILAIDGDVSDYNDNTMSLEALNIDLDAIIADIGNPSARTNSQTIEAMLGNADTANVTLAGIIGGEYVNNGGNPDVDNIRAHLRAGLVNGTGTVLPANKSLYDIIGTTYVDGGGVFNADSVWDDLRTVGQYLIDGTAGAEAGTVLPAGKSLYDALSGGVDAVDRIAGKSQIAATTEDLNQAAASYDLFTGTTQDVILESLSIRLPNVDVSDDAALTSISIQNDDVTPQVYISSVEGDVANLTAEAQLGWTGTSLIKTGTKIQLTIAGGAADAATVCDVVVRCRAVVDLGYLA